jgi:hypothetical protein
MNIVIINIPDNSIMKFDAEEIYFNRNKDNIEILTIFKWNDDKTDLIPVIFELYNIQLLHIQKDVK